MDNYSAAQRRLKSQPSSWLVTGVAGFIGSHLLEALLKLDQSVVGLDSFVTGRRHNLDEVRNRVDSSQWKRFNMIEGDIRDSALCMKSCHHVDYVLHHAALGSVPGSLMDPLSSHESNVSGFLNVLIACRENRVKRLIYASSSAVYGDSQEIPAVEGHIGRLLSPYAASKFINEVYASVFAKCNDLETIGLRYFNVFGPRQDPKGAYAAVIPRWIGEMLEGRPVRINGDGETSRDFCYVADVVQANILAATAERAESANQTYNIAVGQATTLNQLLQLLQKLLPDRCPAIVPCMAEFGAFRDGDVRHSQADISKASQLLGYRPQYVFERGLAEALDWYVQNLNGASVKLKSSAAIPGDKPLKSAM